MSLHPQSGTVEHSLRLRRLRCEEDNTIVE